MGEGIEVWRGSVATWECDSMGHMNVGFYVAKAMEGLVGLAAGLGMPRAFGPRAEATLVLRELHIRFLREARVGARLHIDAGVLEMGEDDASVLLLMRHHDGELCAAFRMRLAHVTAWEGRAFPWPAWARAHAAALALATPEKAAPRSVQLGSLESSAGLARADELGLTRTGAGAVRPCDVDVFGRMEPQALMARVSDCVAHLFEDRLAGVAGGSVGAVVLEYRFLYLDWAGVGDRIELRSGFSGAEPRLRRMVHWLLDPASGRPWASAEAVTTAFDVEARRMIVLSDDELVAWSRAVTPGLAI